MLPHHRQPVQPSDPIAGIWHCLWLLTFPAILFSRWDIQRIREQRILQRLQLRMYKRKGIQESEPEVTSFFPEPDDVESLLITPYLPVVAFGRPLPKLTPQNFELPWLDERSRCRLEVQKKQTPHRTCRK